MDNQPDNQIKIEVIQAGVNPDRAKEGFPPIALERTNKTGLLHKDGAVSMARRQRRHARRRGCSSASTISRRSISAACGTPDGQGFAAFGRVVRGMDVVRKIQTGRPTPTRRG